MTRRHLIAVGAALALAFAAGCGDSPGPPEIGHASSGPITKQRVEEFGRAVNLRADDLPGSEAGPAEESDTNPEREAEAERCFGEAADPDEVASDESPSFRYSVGGEFAQFQSTVAGARTEEEVAALIAAFETNHGFRCLKRFLRDQLEEEETQYLTIEFSKIHRPVPLSSPALGLRIHVSFEVDGGERDGYVDFIFFIAGHAQVTLAAVGMPTPVSQDVEGWLVSRLAERAERHAL
jgi:hypothetical protein